MTKSNNGDFEDQPPPSPWGQEEKPEPSEEGFFEKSLKVSAALAAVSFLTHIFFLLLVDPWFILPLSKESAIVYGAVPLAFGLIFALFSILSFTQIPERRGLHILLLLAAVIFGTLSLQGLLGSALHYAKLARQAPL